MQIWTVSPVLEILHFMLCWEARIVFVYAGTSAAASVREFIGTQLVRVATGRAPI